MGKDSVGQESEFSVIGSAGEGDDVTDVGHAGHKENETLEAEAESRVGNGTEAASVKIPPQDRKSVV